MIDELRDTARIFVVEDEPVNLSLLDKILTGQGFAPPVLIQDPRDVLTRYREGRPDLILLDINMPHLDGYQVMDQLRGLNDPLLPPIVILTAQHSRDYLLRALEAGARDFVSKPFDRSELLMRVSNLLAAQWAHCMVHEQKAVLEEMVQARTEMLNQTRLQVVRRLGRASEYRDNETGLHIIRMSQYSSLLARSLGWAGVDCDLMLHASPMHDVGKIGIPDAVLLKPGKLDAHEWEIMKKHTTIGADILENDSVALLRLAREIALTHHEKWDGSGYPNGLVRHAIPQSGRIVAVADVFDALTSARPYKKAWAIDDAVDYVIDHAGTHFDPEVVVHFQKCVAQFIEIGKRHREPQPGQSAE